MMDCKAKTLDFGDCYSKYDKPSADGTKTYGITIELRAISPYGVHNATLSVHFSTDWGAASDGLAVFSPGQKKTYTDPDGAVWEVWVDSTVYVEGGGTAETQICFEEGMVPDPDPDPEPKTSSWLFLFAVVAALYLLLRRE
jgi:hypothetical protein